MTQSTQEKAKTTAEIRALFDHHYEGRTERRDGTGFDWAYDAIRFADDVNVTIDREYGGRILELHVRDDAGAWAAPGVALTPPEVRSGSYTGDGFEYAIKPANVRNSSMMMDSTTHARALAFAIELACDYADAWTIEATPELEAEIARRVESDRKSQLKREAEQERRDGLRALLDETAAGRPVRVTTTNGNEFTGELATDVYGANVEVGGKKVDLDAITRVEVKQDNGRYQVRLSPGWNAKLDEVTA